MTQNQKNDDKKIAALELQLNKMQAQVTLLSKKILFLERENNRRKTESNQIVSALKKL